MNPSAALQRRRRRRVADEDRKRAARACDRCKARKSKCIESSPGLCQRCQQSNMPCRFRRRRSLSIESDEQPRRHSSISQHVAKSPEDNISIDSHQTERVVWPRFLSKLREAFSLDSHAAPEEQDMVAMQARLTRPTMLLAAELRRLQVAIEAFPPRPVADFLLSVCINHGTDAFFYFDQARFLSDIDEFYIDPQSPLRLDFSFVSLALAAFALGSQWTTLERPQGNSGLVLDDDDPCRIFHNQARSLLPDIIDRPDLRSIQALFIMGVYLLPASALGPSYIYLGLALRKALALDLHQNADDASLDEREREVRRRLWWAVYSLERLATVKLNRPRSISSSIITVPLPSPLPALDAVQKFDNLPIQAANAKLVLILDRVAEPGNVDGEKSAARVMREGEADLKEWRRSLPPGFKLESISPKDSNYRAVFHLYMNYYFAWIAMGKVSVVTVVRAYLRYHLAHERETTAIGETTNELSKSCFKAAKKMIQLFESLTGTGNLSRFSFTDFQGCSIATTVTLLGGILERDSAYEARVNFGMECLRKMAAGNLTAKMGVRFVEALRSISNEAVEKLRHNRSGPSTAEDNGKQTSDYNRWVEWLSQADRGPLSRDITPAGRQVLVEPDLPAMPSSPWAANTPVLEEGTSGWDPVGGHMLPTNPLVSPELTQSAATSQDSPAVEGDFLSSLYTDEQAFLMGLTGLDVLNFSGEMATQLE